MKALPGSDALISVFRSIAVDAGQAIIAHYGSADQPTTKADASPVTLADLAADDIIHAGLTSAFPDIPVVTEERISSHTNQQHRAFFLVDPLDGTKEFISGCRDFTVNIALIKDGRPIAGVVHAPARDRMFLGHVEAGAMEEASDTGECHAICTREAHSGALSVVMSGSHKNQDTFDYMANYPIASITDVGSSLKFCLVASGEADLYPRLSRTMEWDTAAGHAVLISAGGRVDRVAGGPLTYGKAGFENPHFVAYGRGVAPVIMRDTDRLSG